MYRYIREAKSLMSWYIYCTLIVELHKQGLTFVLQYVETFETSYSVVGDTFSNLILQLLLGRFGVPKILEFHAGD